MAGKVKNAVNNMFNSIGAMQTLVEVFPMNFITYGNGNFSTSFDVIGILLKILGVDREELIDVITIALCGNMKDTSDGSGFISNAEEIVKLALETNITNILNCTTNPIISNNLLDSFRGFNDVELSGEGILLNVSEIDFTGVLSRNPFNENNSKFYFDIEDKTPNNIWRSKDFNAFLWYILNKSDKSQYEERIWDNRYKAQIYGNKNDVKKEIIRCTYIDDEYPNTDKLKVQICGARYDNDGNLGNANYYKTRNLLKDGKNISLNKTIFEFNHDFLSSIKLYEPKVIIAEIVEYLLGDGNLNLNLGFSINEEIIQGKIQEIIRKVIETDDIDVSDCYFSFSNEEYNNMLIESERKRYNVIYNGRSYHNSNLNDILNNLSGVTNNSTLIEDRKTIKKTINDIIAIPAQDPFSQFNISVDYDWQFELIRALVYPFIRPLFTPKVIFLLLVNKNIMGSLSEIKSTDDLINNLLKALFIVIKDIIIKLKELIVELLLKFIMDKLKPLLQLLASRLLLETLKMYKDLLEDIQNNCSLRINRLIGVIDDVNYADIIPSQTEPNQTTC